MNKLDELDTITRDYLAKLGEIEQALEEVRRSLPTKPNWWEDNFPYSIYRDNTKSIQSYLDTIVDITLNAHRQSHEFARKEAKYEKTDEKID